MARLRRSSRNSAKPSKAAAGGGPRLGQGCPQAGIPRLGREERAHVACPGTGLAHRAVDEDGRDELGRQVAPSVLQGFRNRAEACDGVADQRGLRTQAVEEQAEHAVEPGVQIDLGLPAPPLPLGHDPPAGQGRDDEVAIDPLGRSEAGVGRRPEPLPPGGTPAAPLLERLGRQVVEPVVEVGETEAAGHDRRGLVLLGEKLPAERGERGQTLNFPTIAPAAARTGDLYGSQSLTPVS